jgi:hypothetical protein
MILLVLTLSPLTRRLFLLGAKHGELFTTVILTSYDGSLVRVISYMYCAELLLWHTCSSSLPASRLTLLLSTVTREGRSYPSHRKLASCVPLRKVEIVRGCVTITLTLTNRISKWPTRPLPGQAEQALGMISLCTTTMRSMLKAIPSHHVWRQD